MAKKLVSIDLETLDTKTSSVILEIGIVVGLEDGTVLEKFQVFPTIEDQIAAGRTISGDTILWWMKQDEVIVQEQGNAKRRSHADCVQHVHDFLAGHLADALVLGNAPSFDCEILADFLGGKPWAFYLERDVRSARMAVPKAEQFKNHAEHSGLADAMAQYMDFVTFLRKARA